MSVGTNNAAGYVLTMSATDSDLVNVADSTKTIPTLATKTGGYTDADFTTNAWGYKNGITNNYFPFNASGATILSSSTRTNNDSTTLRFAAKVDYTKPSGLYEQELNFTITANMATYYMQDLDPVVCTEDPIEAIDTRDNNTYWVAELADGNCWMLQNLQLGSTLTNPSDTLSLTPANTNISQNYTLNNKLAVGKFPYENPDTGVAGPITDDVTGENANVYNHNALYCTPDGDNNYHGCYYNWYTATAGSGTSNVTGKDTDGVDVNESICPRGWVLPKAGTSSDNDFQKLYEAMGSPAFTEMLVNPTDLKDNANGAYKPGFLLSGRYTSTTVGYLDSAGYYWSRTAYSRGHGYYLTSSISRFNPQGYGGKYNGRSVRCLRETRKIGDIENMQDISPAIVANTNSESSAILKDTRDNQEYTVAKLKDGKVWMTQNLQLGKSLTAVSGTMALTPMDSNISTNYTLGNKVSDGIMPVTGCSTSDCEDVYDKSTYIYNGNGFYCTPDSTNDYVGCYYNWYTATASTGTSSITGKGTTGVDVDSSICPKGWYLPKGGSNSSTNDFWLLYNQYPSVNEMLVSNPTTTFNNVSGLPKPGYLVSGRYTHIGSLNVGTFGFYWSRTTYSRGMTYILNVKTTSITTQDSNHKGYAFSVRCLAY